MSISLRFLRQLLFGSFSLLFLDIHTGQYGKRHLSLVDRRKNGLGIVRIRHIAVDDDTARDNQ